MRRIASFADLHPDCAPAVTARPTCRRYAWRRRCTSACRCPIPASRLVRTAATVRSSPMRTVSGRDRYIRATPGLGVAIDGTGGEIQYRRACLPVSAARRTERCSLVSGRRDDRTDTPWLLLGAGAALALPFPQLRRRPRAERRRQDQGVRSGSCFAWSPPGAIAAPSPIRNMRAAQARLHGDAGAGAVQMAGDPARRQTFDLG